LTGLNFDLRPDQMGLRNQAKAYERVAKLLNTGGAGRGIPTPRRRRLSRRQRSWRRARRGETRRQDPSGNFATRSKGWSRDQGSERPRF
jgi:hypothetical protein